MHRIKKELNEIYLALDGHLQRNWRALLLIGYIVILVFLAFRPDKVDFDAISAHLP